MEMKRISSDVLSGNNSHLNAGICGSITAKNETGMISEANEQNDRPWPDVTERILSFNSCGEKRRSIVVILLLRHTNLESTLASSMDRSIENFFHGESWFLNGSCTSAKDRRRTTKFRTSKIWRMVTLSSTGNGGQCIIWNFPSSSHWMVMPISR